MDLLYDNMFYNTKKSITPQDIQEVEEQYQFTFPKDIRRHYLAYNGGKSERYIFKSDGNEYAVQKFLSIGGELEILLDMLRSKDKILPDWLIPLAEDPGGNLFCFS